MPLTTWKPVTSLFDIHTDMSRFFDDFWARPRRDNGNGEWVPAIDVSETESGLIVRAEIPGVSENDVHVSVADNTLTLKGEKKQTSEKEGENYHRVERRFGGFQRAFTLPNNLQTEKTSAAFKNGVLTVSIPKAEAVRPKEIEITAS